ncbi:hypothetical protein [Deinococcus pimensis]|uniref:hypothetical protein n=1 Tax=Deinococcus pimensis TaxID=309888 RepID=UPI000480C777|nr:hypothetical protein [Deinococcus pimensis]
MRPRIQVPFGLFVLTRAGLAISASITLTVAYTFWVVRTVPAEWFAFVAALSLSISMPIAVIVGPLVSWTMRSFSVNIRAITYLLVFATIAASLVLFRPNQWGFDVEDAVPLSILGGIGGLWYFLIECIYLLSPTRHQK